MRPFSKVLVHENQRAATYAFASWAQDFSSQHRYSPTGKPGLRPGLSVRLEARSFVDNLSSVMCPRFWSQH